MSPQTTALSRDEAAAWRAYLQDAPAPSFPLRADRTASAAPSSLISRDMTLRFDYSATSVFVQTVVQTAWALMNVCYSDAEEATYGIADLGEAPPSSGTRPSTLTAVPARFAPQADDTIASAMRRVRSQGLPRLGASQKLLGAIASLGPDVKAATEFDNQLILVWEARDYAQRIVLDRAINVECIISGQKIRAKAYYDAAIVDAAQMERILATLDHLVQQLGNAANQSLPLTSLRLVSDADVVQLTQWNPALPFVDDAASWVASTWKTPDYDPTISGKAARGAIWLTQSGNPQRLVPIGAIGEILVEESQLAEGYLDAAKSADRFVAAPAWLGTTPSDLAIGRLYRTGDLGRYRSDGSLQILGQRAITSTAESTQDQPAALTTADEQQIWQWNKDAWPQHETGCIHSAIERQVALTPNRIAIDSWDGQLTFAELDDLSSRLASHLTGLGIGPEVLVPMCFDKSAWTVVTMLANFKAGGCNVMLNPNHPVARLQEIVALTGAQVVLTAPQHSQHFAAMNVRAVSIDKAFILALPKEQSARVKVGERNAAIVVFTSGSTGKPKGIVLEHKSFMTVTRQHCPALGFQPGMRVLQFAHFTFDMSNAEIFSVLIYGGTVCIATEDDRVNNLGRVVSQMRIDWLLLTPTVAGLLDPKDTPDLKTLCLIGEAVDQACVDRWSPHVKLINSYGPAEATMWTSHSVCLPGVAAANIGRGFGGRLWIVDPENHNRMTPMGEIGELVIDGPIVTRGYLNEPEKTAAVFIDNPTWLVKREPNSHHRIYKTGDLVKYCPDGTMLFLGRKDSQVKLHGQRLELGEVEHSIRVLDEVETAMVILPKEGQCKGRLTTILAFKALNPATHEGMEVTWLLDSPKAAELLESVREQVAAKLPSYMVPTVWVVLDSLPVTPSRKVNRSLINGAIKDMSKDVFLTVIGGGEKDEEPTTEMEKKINDVWSRVLDMSPGQVGVSRSLLSLGGDSVAAMQIVSRCRTEHGLELSVKEILQAKGVSAIAANAKAVVEQKVVEPFALIGGAAKFAAQNNFIANQCKVLPSDIEDVYPCTPMQEGMMAESAAEPGSYVLQHAMRIPESVDLARLQRVWQDAMTAYPILRTRIVHIKGLGSCQVVTAAGEKPIAWGSSRDVDSFLDLDLARPLGYGDALTRFAIVQQPDGARFFVWTIHHAIYDGAMGADLLERIEHAYNGQALPASLPFSHFVERLVHDRDAAVSDEFWKSQFAGLDPSTPTFPTMDESYKPCVSRYVNHDLTLKPTRVPFTSSVLLRSAWAIVMAQLSDVADVVLGVTQWGRDMDLPGLDTCLGPCLTTVPVRISVDGELTCKAFLNQVQTQYADMTNHQHSSLRSLRKLGPAAEFACNLTNLLVVQPQTAETSAILQKTDKGHTDDQLNFAFVLECFMGEKGQMTIHAGFDEAVLTVDQVDLLVHRLEHVLHELGSEVNQNRPLAGLSTVSDKDMAALESFNPVIDTWKQCLHSEFEEQARLRPNAMAVDSWDAKFTFATLLDYANRVAGELVRLGVGPGSVVPFAFNKSAWAVVAMHGILRAGGACVALDMSHPPARHAIIVEDVKATVIVASTEHEDAIRMLGTQVVAIDQACMEDLVRLPKGLQMARPEDAAFVVYSSGSTGTPKGSLLTHQSLISTSRTNSQILGVGPHTRAIGFASHSFDVAIEENVLIPMLGGCVCIPTDEERLNDLAAAMTRLQVNWADLTPAVARLLTPERAPTLRTMVLGGECLTQDIIDTWATRISVFNTYGPSECSIQCTVSTKLGESARGRNIGRPANCQLWVVDAQDAHKLLPPGCVGELLIEGPIVGQGYLGRPTLTESVFVQGLGWTADKTRRFYRTADLAAFNPDGTLEFFGRRDRQVKVHGQRIEPGEIEYAFGKASGLSVAVEAVAPQASNRTLLAAFVHLPTETSSSGADFVMASLTPETRKLLETTKAEVSVDLPGYMVPTLYIPIDNLPMNTSGKIDRKKLREAAENFSQAELSMYSLLASDSSSGPSSAGGAYANETETLLARLWAEVLNIDTAKDPIWANDNFMGLGADSITAMLLVGKAKEAGLELSVAGIMRNGRLSDMAQAARPAAAQDAQNAAAAAQVVKLPPYSAFKLLTPHISLQQATEVLQAKYDIESDAVEDMYPCTPLQEGVMALAANDASAYILREIYTLPAETDIRRFKASWSTVMRRNPILRTRVVYLDGVGSFQVVLDERIRWKSSDNLETYLTQDRTKTMGYGEPLSRWALVQEADGTTKFAWSIHHALYDGLSLDLTLDAVNHAYHHDLTTTELAPFSQFMRFLAQTDKDAERTFWTEQFHEVEAIPFPEPPKGHQCQSDNTVAHSLQLPLNRASSEITISTLLKTAWAMVVARRTDTTDVVFGLVQSGRDVLVDDAMSINGPTITTVPLRVRLNQYSSVAEVLAAVQEQALDMIPYAHAGIQNIQKMLGAAGRDVCGFQNGLVIQPAETESDGADKSLFGSMTSATGLGMYRGFSLAVECALGPNHSINIRAHHDSHVIQAPEVTRLLVQFEQIIEQLCAIDETTTAGDVDMFCGADYADLAAWNCNPSPPVDKCIQQLVCRFATTTPDALAIETRDIKVTYRELDELSTDLAHKLRAMGVGLETMVPMCIDLSPNGLITMLAVAKAGGVFVPINPADAIERLKSLVEEVDAKIAVFTDKTVHLQSAIAAGLKTIVLPNSVFPADKKTLNLKPLDSITTPSSAAYAIFTSGSTGRPKAVVMTHRALCSSITALGRAIFERDTSSSDPNAVIPPRFLQATSYAWDASLGELFVATVYGGCICIPTEAEKLDALSTFLRDMRIDVAFQTPSFARTLKPEQVPDLKMLITGGEGLTKEVMSVWGDAVRLVNAYGPTEACIACTCSTVVGPNKASTIEVVDSFGKHYRRQTKPDNIGPAFSGRGWVVDPADHNRLVPVGCVGELLLQGHGLARGYYNNPQKTAEAFVPAPAWLHKFGYASEGERLYKTGDLVRQNLADGSFTILGRRDEQTKINGQRVELGEIETQVTQQAQVAVERAVVVASKTKLNTSKQAVAAFVQLADAGATPDKDAGLVLLATDEQMRARLHDLAAAVRLALPKYMVPTFWIPVASFPIMKGSSKTDRKKLKATFSNLEADQLAAYSLENFVKAAEPKTVQTVTGSTATDAEQTIIQLLATILGRDSKTITAADSFFGIGGDSIIAVELVAKARAAGLELKNEDILRQPILRDIARNAQGDAKGSSYTETVVPPVKPFSLLPRATTKDAVLQAIAAEHGIQSDAVEDVLPCTPLQEGLLALTVQDTDAYVLRQSWRLPANFNVAKFRGAWDVLMRDTAVLRTQIVNLESHGCLQVVMKELDVWDEATSLSQYAEHDRATPFGYGSPLCRLALVQDPKQGAHFFLAMHHSIYDGWSMGLLLHKLQEAYTSPDPAASMGPSPPFSRFIEFLTSTNALTTKAFWQGQFADFEMQAFPRLPSASFSPLLDSEKTVDIKLVRKAGSSFATSSILKAAWALLLSRYTGSNEAMFGIVQMGRDVPVEGVTSMIGPTITTVPLRIQLDKQGSVSEYLRAIQDQAAAMTTYGHAGLQNIARMDQNCRNACAFTNLMVIQPGDNPSRSANDGFLGEAQKHGSDADFMLRFGLALECTLGSDGNVSIAGRYDSRLLSQTQMGRLLRQLATVIEKLSAEPDTLLGDVDMISPDERAEMDAMQPKEPPVYELAQDAFQRMVATQPGAPAVHGWDVELTYSALDGLSNRLAHKLRSMGVGPETKVPLCFEKSGWAVVAFLAVVKAGGVTVFLDPEYPETRRNEILSQLDATVVLGSATTKHLWKTSDLRLQIVDRRSLAALPSVARDKTAPTVTDLTPNNALYIVFTSGSTGTPKGCVIEHHSYTTSAEAQARLYHITSSSRLLQSGKYTFDITVLEILTTLRMGACVCVPNEDDIRSRMAETINKFHITWVFMTPSVSRFLEPRDVPSLQTILIGGEPLSPQTIEAWNAQPGLQMMNTYGPSECTIVSTVNNEMTPTTDPANIGYPMAGPHWIADADDFNKLAPLGTVGELLIEGPVVGRGYLNNPTKTAEVFVQNPTWANVKDGETRRLYRTGDLAYINGEGCIIFVGRKDTQVKVRGQRMELGEVETHISHNKETRDVIVVYPTTGPCKHKLTAIVTLANLGGTINQKGLIEQLESRLLTQASDKVSVLKSDLAALVPGYMVPTLWIVLKSFPMLTSGKLDRKRVKGWIDTMDDATHSQIRSFSSTDAAEAVHAPVSDTETTLREIWSEVLKVPVDEIGTTQDFSALGGDSIIAMVVLSKMRKHGLTSMTMAEMLKARTIGNIAALLEQRSATSSDSGTIAESEAHEEAPGELFDLSPIQQSYADLALGGLNYLSLQTNSHFNHTICFRVTSRVSGSRLMRALEAVVERHSMLRVRHVRTPDAACGWKQYIASKDKTFESFRFRAWDGYSLDQVKPWLEQARTSLDLEHGPLMAADLVTVPSEDNEGEVQSLYVVAHHLVVDLVSWSTIMRDLEDFLASGTFTADPPFPFSAWSTIQAEHAAQALAPEVAYPLTVPAADLTYWGMHKRPNLGQDTVSRGITIPEKQTTALVQTCQSLYDAEPMDVLVAALSHSFSLVFRDRATPTIFRYGHGRDASAVIGDKQHVDLSGTVGWFSTLSPIHVPVGDGTGHTHTSENTLSVLARAVATRNRIPGNGAAYFASRYHHPAGRAAFADHDNMEVTVNYLGGRSKDALGGHATSLFALPQATGEGGHGGLEPDGHDQKSQSLFSVTAEVWEGRLQLRCMWNRTARGQADITAWFQKLEMALLDLAFCAAAGQKVAAV